MRAAALLLGLAVMSARAEVPRPVFYLPLDGGTTAALAGGSATPVRQQSRQNDPILELLDLRKVRTVPGRVGPAHDIGDQPLVYECAGNFRADEGTCSFWVNPSWRGDDHALYSTLFGAANWGMVYKYQDQSSLTFATAKPDKDLYYDCGAPDISAWRPGQWHHVVATWSRQQNARRLYVDGRLAGSGPFGYHREVKSGPLFVGAGCSMYPQPTAQATLDEFALWDRPLDAAAIGELHARGQAGQPLCDVPARTDRPVAERDTLRVAAPRLPAPPAPNEPVTRRAGTRTLVSLDGWWALRPAETDGDLPDTGWGLGRVPGYWTTPADRLGPDGRPWNAPELARCWLAAYQRTFTADPAWRTQQLRLHLGGVDGLAQVFFNGRLLGWLPAWEHEEYLLNTGLRFGEANTVTVLLRTRGGGKVAGVYGHVGLVVTPGPSLAEVAIRPQVERGRVEFALDVRAGGPAGPAVLEFTVSPKGQPQQVVRRFSRPVEVASGTAVSPVVAAFDWPDAHRWCTEDPYLYDLTVSLRRGNDVLDQIGPLRFGYREVTQRGGDLLLNGQPLHLRGHQIDLPWGHQMDRVKELKPAGLNGLELSGPISCEWYRDAPYQQELFEQILDYCDEHGLIAAPILPDAKVLRERLFEPAVAAAYQQRLRKHLRRYGNHAGWGLSYMHFNLAGYNWYVAPSKVDGAHKPDDAGFKAKERYAREAQRLAQAVDPRPLYHHACGNFGDIFTNNCYLGPNSPTQEREEWPSAWAAKRPFPLIAAEHCFMLIPYWFRPRQFPLSVVYAGEPIFDEICAMYQGPAAYGQLSDELFERYDMGRAPRGSRLMALIRNHPGYQAVKADLGRRSLRAWRTYGVSGIIFNAENWDFTDDAGRPLPVQQAMARYCGDTDLYLAGPGRNWPSKDHAFHGGEVLDKQVVLINDRNQDVRCELRWSLRDAAGAERDSGRAEAVAPAGVPAFVPVRCRLPQVTQRTDLTLTVAATSTPAGLFQPDRLAIQVFPRRSAPPAVPPVLLHDPVGDTRAMLAKAGVATAPLTAGSDLSQAATVVVGRRAYDERFLALAKATGLEAAVRQGLRLVVFEQTGGQPCGLRLTETSTRDVFAAVPEHPLLAGLAAADWRDWRGESDVIAPYPDAPPETARNWPARGFKWGNRGIVATYVYARPHNSPFRALLHCGFDLAQSPLLEAAFGRGAVTLCQLDVTGRYGVDPVATLVVDRLLRPAAPSAPRAVTATGAASQRFLAAYGIAPGEAQSADGLIVNGEDPVDAPRTGQVVQAARAGATVLLLPNATLAAAFGQRALPRRWYLGRWQADPLLSGLTAGDLFVKAWTTSPVVVADDGWRPLVEPGVLAVKSFGAGRVIAGTLDPGALPERGRVKVTRFWSLLLANLGADRNADTAFLTEPRAAYLPTECETIPPYMNW